MHRVQVIGIVTALALALGCSGRIADTPASGGPNGNGNTPAAPGNTPGSKSCSAFEVGRTPARRLNSREFLNATSALLGIDARAVVQAADLPADISSRHGFDNDGTVARTFPQDADRIYNAANKLVAEAFKSGPPPALDCRNSAQQATSIKPDAPAQSVTVTFHENDPIGDGYYGDKPNTGDMTVNGTLEIKMPASLFAADVGRLTLTMRGDSYDGVWPSYSLRVDGQAAGGGTLASATSTPVVVAVNLAAKTAHTLEITFDNNQCCKTTNGIKQDVNLFVEAIALEPKSAAGSPSDPAACREQRLRAFLLRAFRRPPSDAEVARYVKLADAQTDPQQGMAFAATAALMSPHFLFHIVDDSSAQPGQRYQLDGYQLASRLSFFLWGSIPDQPLLDAAKSGQLGTRDALATQVKRMLADPRADELRKSFPEQWLRYGDIELKHRDPQKFPQFSAQLAADMKTETTMLLSDIIDKGAPLQTLLSADYTFVNRSLAELYGMAGAASLPSDSFTRRALDTSQRRGLLSHASVLTATTEGDFTHPILRGLWVLTAVMCSPPGEPPDGIPPLSDVDPTLPIKQRLAQHRTDASCAACHNDIDPIGLGLENYDPIGQWRDHDGQHPVDPSGKLPDGFSFSGPAELSAHLAKTEAFRSCFARHVAAFAVGRSIGGGEQCQITSQLDDKSTIADVITAIVTADAFSARTRQ